VEDNVDVWRYAILELHARNDDEWLMRYRQLSRARGPQNWHELAL